MQEFKVGDTVRIRDWDDMADEFGCLASTGSIQCNGSFTVGMRYLCGLEFQIASLVERVTFASTRSGYIVHLEPKEKLKMPDRDIIPMITDEMIELVRNRKEFVCVNTTAIDDFIM